MTKKIIIFLIAVFILMLIINIFTMLLFDTSMLPGWDYFMGNFTWRPSLAWYSYIIHHALVIMMLAFLFALIASTRTRQVTLGFLKATVDNATSPVNKKFGHLPLSIRITASLIMLYVFYMFFIANYRELMMLVYALVIGDGYWGNMHASNFRWGLLTTTLVMFILGTLIANGLLKQNRTAYWSVGVLFAWITASVVYYAGISIYILSTTEDSSVQPIGLSTHMGHYAYLVIYIATLCLVLPLLVSLVRNRALFLKRG